MKNEPAKTMSMEKQVKLANMAVQDEMKIITVDGRQMVKLGDDLLDEAQMNDWFNGLIQKLEARGLELTEHGVGRVLR